MKYLAILDFSTGTIIIEPDPNPKDLALFDYDEYIRTTYGKIEYYYMIGTNINIDI